MHLLLISKYNMNVLIFNTTISLDILSLL